MKWLRLVAFTTVLVLFKYVSVARKMKNHDFRSDIIISPCGLYGLYNLGICHYIKNHFVLKNKKIAGVSSGSFNAIFLCLNKKSSDVMLTELFRLNNLYCRDIKGYAKNVLISMNNHFTIDDLKKDRDLYIGLAHTNDLRFYHNFDTMEKLMKCCMGSSFIPKITHKNLMYFYENRYTVDGAVWYKYFKKYIDTDKTLVISPKMFNRYGHRNIIYDSLFKKDFQLYQLYLNGYHDARKNHNYLCKYLDEK
jgi:hypothetical protein